MIKKTETGKYIDCSYGPPIWQYKCLVCGNIFEMPAAKGPSEEKSRSCPGCRRNNIKRFNVVISGAFPPGG